MSTGRTRKVGLDAETKVSLNFAQMVAILGAFVTVIGFFIAGTVVVVTQLYDIKSALRGHESAIADLRAELTTRDTAAHLLAADRWTVTDMRLWIMQTERATKLKLPPVGEPRSP